MVPKERLMVALRKEKPDRLPISVHQWQTKFFRQPGRRGTMNRMANSSSDVAMTLGKLPVVGEAVPDFEFPDSMAVPRRLSALVTPDPLVLLFYRGSW